MAEMTAVVHTHTHTHTQGNLKKEKINKIVANSIMYIVGIGLVPIRITSVMFAHTDKYKIDEFLI